MATSEFLKFLSIWISFKSCTSFIKVKFRNIISHLKSTLVLFVPVIATSIYRSMDKIMLGSMSTVSETGLYEYSEKIIFMLLGFITSLEIVMMPKISNLLENGKKDEALNNISKSMIFVSFLTCAMSFGITGISERFVPWFYGEEFLGCKVLLPPLAITLCFIGWANVIRTQFIVPLGRDRLYVISTIIGAVINLIINIILIPIFGAMGAVIGTIGAELSVALFLSYMTRKELPIRKYLLASTPFVIIGVIMAIAVHLVGRVISNNTFSIIAQILIGVIIYIFLAGCYLYKYQKELFNLIIFKLHF